MLPNLGQLSLHEEARTMGFYEPTEEEQAAMNDDPVTLEKPLHTMTFRVRLPEDGPNGEPRYKYFSPTMLWQWVKDHDMLPAREGPVWYEDWWALCNTYNPDHHDIPAWAHRLKRRSEYVAERARERAAQAQQAARANARADREAEAAPAAAAAAAPAAAAPAAAPQAELVEAPQHPLRRLPRIPSGATRHGPRNVADHLVQWRFWVKSSTDMLERPDDGSVPVGVLGDSIKYNFGQTMDASGFVVGGSRGGGRRVDHWRWRLMVNVRSFTGFYDGEANYAVLNASPGATKRITCRLYLPRFAAQPFIAWMQTKIDDLGMTEAFWQIFGVSEARVFFPRDALRNRGPYYNLPNEAQPASLPIMSQASFDSWRPLRFRAWGTRGRHYDEAQRDLPAGSPPPA